MVLHTLQDNYFFLRRFRDSTRICDSLIDLEPDKPIFKFYKATTAFAETAELANFRAVLNKLWPLSEGDWDMTYSRLCASIYGRDWAAAKEALNTFLFPREEHWFPGHASICGSRDYKEIIRKWKALSRRLATG
jgi:hypothetical protein